jgi:site-specific recombinase XerD
MTASSVDLPTSFQRHLRAENKSARTVETYLEAVQQLDSFLRSRDVDLPDAGRDDIEAYLTGLLGRWKPATAANRYRALRVFYAWLEDEGEIAADPMAKMQPPASPEQPVPVLPDEALRRLFAACAGKDFEGPPRHGHDHAVAGLGCRPGRAGRLRVDDLDFEHDVARVIGKGRRERALPFGRKTAVALDRYLRIRSRHAHAASPWLWLGQKDRSPLRAWHRCSDAGAARRASRACTRTSCATRSPTPGSPRVG